MLKTVIFSFFHMSTWRVNPRKFTVSLRKIEGLGLLRHFKNVVVPLASRCGVCPNKIFTPTRRSFLVHDLAGKFENLGISEFYCRKPQPNSWKTINIIFYMYELIWEGRDGSLDRWLLRGLGEVEAEVPREDTDLSARRSRNTIGGTDPRTSTTRRHAGTKVWDEVWQRGGRPLLAGYAGFVESETTRSSGDSRLSYCATRLGGIGTSPHEAVCHEGISSGHQRHL